LLAVAWFRFGVCIEYAFLCRKRETVGGSSCGSQLTKLRLFALPYLLLFVESEVDRLGAPVDTRRPQRIAMQRLTLGAQGLRAGDLRPASAISLRLHNK
jgi:hypothetical protein